jgi:hypothetical protein
LYTRNINLDDYFIFKFFLRTINDVVIVSTDIVFLSILVGFLLVIILSISLLMNRQVKSNSFIGSFKFNDAYFEYFFRKIMLIIFAFFFGLIIFNFFMEWFALVVDDIILVLGMIYYLFVYLHKHSKINTKYLETISDTGNDFFETLIKKFSNKKTFFIGVSFLLTLHLLVDVGVFLVPYTTGINNEFYLNSLGQEDHLPIFFSFDTNELSNLLTFENTQLNKDTTILRNEGVWDISFVFGFVLIYFVGLFLAFSCMILPFYIFFNNIRNKKIKLNKYFSIIFLSSVFFYFSFKAFESLNFPIKIVEIPAILAVKGVDIISLNIIPFDVTGLGLDLLYSTLLFLFLIFIIYFRYDKYVFYFTKMIYLFILIFFVYYIYLFSSSVLSVDKNEIVNVYNLDGENYDFSENKYVSINNLILNNNSFKLLKFSEVIHSNSVIGNLYEVNGNYFIKGKISKVSNPIFTFGNKNNLYVNKNNYYDFYEEFIKIPSNFSFIYYVGNDFKEKYVNSNGEIIKDSNLIPNLLSRKDIKTFDMSVKSEKTSLDNLNSLILLFRFVLVSVFYIFGIIAFTVFYIRKNILEN